MTDGPSSRLGICSGRIRLVMGNDIQGGIQIYSILATASEDMGLVLQTYVVMADDRQELAVTALSQSSRFQNCTISRLEQFRHAPLQSLRVLMKLIVFRANVLKAPCH